MTVYLPRIRSLDPLAVGAVGSLAAVLRLFALDQQSMWFDEALSISIAKYPLGDVLRSPMSVDPPLFYVLLHFWMTVTSTDWGIRALSAVLGIVSVIALFWLGRALFDRATGLTAGLIMSVSPFQVYYAQEVRMYTLVTAAVTVSLLAYVSATRTHRAIAWLLFATTMTVAVYSHTFALLALLALDVTWLYTVLRDRRISFGLPLANCLVFASFLPWLPLLYEKTSAVVADLWLATPTPLNVLTSLYVFLMSYTLVSSFVPIALFLVLCLVAFILWSALRWAPPTGENRQRLLLVICLTFVPLVTTFVVSLYHSIYLDRLLIVGTPGYYLLLAWGLTSSKTRRAVQLTALPVVALMLLSLSTYYTNPAYAKPAIRDVTEYLQHSVASGDVVAHTSASTYLVAEHYGGAARGHLFLTSPDTWLSALEKGGPRIQWEHPTEQLLEPYRQVWLVVALDHNSEGQLEVKRWLDQRYALEESQEFAGIGVFRYLLR